MKLAQTDWAVKSLGTPGKFVIENRQYGEPATIAFCDDPDIAALIALAPKLALAIFAVIPLADPERTPGKVGTPIDDLQNLVAWYDRHAAPLIEQTRAANLAEPITGITICAWKWGSEHPRQRWPLGEDETDPDGYTVFNAHGAQGSRPEPISGEAHFATFAEAHAEAQIRSERTGAAIRQL